MIMVTSRSVRVASTHGVASGQPERGSRGRSSVRSAVLAVLTVVALVVGACGGGGSDETLAEEAIERAIERESGEDVDIDFDDGDGISIESEGGSIRIGEDGSFTIEAEDGEVITGQSTDEGFTVETEDGDAVLDVDEESGEVTFESEDGEGSMKSVSRVPDEWPADEVPVPSGLDDVTGTVITSDGQIFITVGGAAPDGAGDYLDAYGAALEDAGYERTSYFESDGFKQGGYESDVYMVSVVADDSGDTSNVVISLFPADA